MVEKQPKPLNHYLRYLSYPAIGVLLLWMAIPLALTLYYAFLDYNLLYPDTIGWTGFNNYLFFFTDPAFLASIRHTILLVGGVLLITVSGGVLLGLLINPAFPGRGLVRVMLLAPFFIMPAVNALLWKNMFFHPVYGIFAFINQLFGLAAIDWFADYPLTAIIIMLAWQWLPFAILIIMTALQSLDHEQVEAATIDGAGGWHLFYYIILPHLSRAIAVVVMIESIFLLSVFAEIYITTGGGPGFDTTTLTFLIFSQALQQFDVGIASAGGIIAIILANIIALFLIRLVGKNLTT